MLQLHLVNLTALQRPPVVRVIDAASRSPVTLVGVMHYNPSSVAITRQTISEAAASGSLGAVCVELCPARWNVTVARRWRREASLERMFFEDEAQVAFEAAQDAAGLDVTLADRPIADTLRSAALLLTATLADLATPAGWGRIGRDLRSGIACLQAEDGAEGLGLRDAFAPDVVAGAPLALMRYLASSPPATALLVLTLATLDRLLDSIAADESVIGAPERLLELALLLAFAATALRVVLVALIDERNVELARNIRAAAAAAAAAAPGEGVVVGVLGMAHVNGVRRLLEESEQESEEASSAERTRLD